MPQVSYLERLKERWQTWSIMHWLFEVCGSAAITTVFGVIWPNWCIVGWIFAGLVVIFTGRHAFADSRLQAKLAERKEHAAKIKLSLFTIKDMIPRSGATSAYSALMVEALSAAAAGGQQPAQDWRAATYAALAPLLRQDLLTQYQSFTAPETSERAAAAFLDSLIKCFGPDMMRPDATP
jgi:hypothetical protein